MTQEHKDLLLKDLCARLPYGVVVATTDNDGTIPNFWMLDSYNRLTEDVRLTNCEVNADHLTDFCDVRPYLFPLSSMTEEQKKDIFHNGKFYIDRHNSLCRFPMYEDDYDFVTMEDCLEIFNKLNKYHFDYRGLIPMGLANDATGLNIY